MTEEIRVRTTVKPDGKGGWRAEAVMLDPVSGVSDVDDLRIENERLREENEAIQRGWDTEVESANEAREALSRFSEALTGPVAVEALTSHLQMEWAGPYMARIRDFTEEEVKAGKLREADEAAENEARKVAAAGLAAAVEAAKKEAGLNG
jgi:hypothetical protein